MRELTYYIGVTLDGFIADPSGDTSAFPVEADLLQVLARDYADAIPSHLHDPLGVTADRSRFDTVVMGWRTYTPALDVGVDHPYAHLRQIVATRSERTVAEGVELTADPLATVRALKAEAGSGIYLAGGGELAGTLMGEIDRLILKSYPLTLGSGVPLFGGIAGTPRRFTPVDSRTVGSGVRITEFVPYQEP